MKKIIMFAVILLFCSCSIKKNYSDFSPEENAVFIRIDDVKDYLDSTYVFEPSAAEYFSFNILFAGIRMYTYQYNYSGDDGAFYLQNTVFISRKGAMRHRRVSDKYSSAFKKQNIDMTEISQIDEIGGKIYLLEMNSAPIGNFLSWDVDGGSGAVILSGIYFSPENAYLLENLLRQKADAAAQLSKTGKQKK